MNIEKALKAHQIAVESVIKSSQQLEALIAKMSETLAAGGKVLWMGNGGSAADAQHMAAELMVRYVKNRQPLASIALTTDSSILTAHSNDYAYESVFARQIEGLAKPGDIVIGLSTSGNSENVVQGITQANLQGCVSVAMTGESVSKLSEISTYCFRVASNETARVQEAHSFICHLLCEGLDEAF
ncbi:MAG: phosphoheptose isomerase [Piscirickettsiaceae bacterium CG_4_9_14_3_um_filter_43_564]|nr:SIS domain-containing protein [Thiomicrospira sp.]OIP93541.1 MAG: phosphoheptose isomerase [Thiomicrospira sp. CG2_30_44_34]PIQ05207.1 MAG: phosphoheptose isomerase [Piscirickettsiaceae bacterium CG18_big_fil_WC_8_21_14_2_50_44_103]PIU38789.1 MAG: phosphoheptose isomerase [Piscirickettsiaceae bacterium CG07_land_8_20_14_0_80_44_28]PIW57133.1 MAG: phosphoheptose isomerase [Piscirickettsiaceae bacterium CG12_big_fil_rev_8_21_14_0_65_44_934]PIW78487.1 MAG: phosphoheptose isomerase [Pisciricket